MQLVAKRDVDVPVEFAFAELTDFEAWERAAMRRGADVQRNSDRAVPGPGTSWDLRFPYRGTERRVQLKLVALTSPSNLDMAMDSTPASGTLKLFLVDLSPNRTRLELRFEVKAKTLAARLLLQSLRLARSRVERSFDQRVDRLVEEFEDRYRRSKKPG